MLFTWVASFSASANPRFTKRTTPVFRAYPDNPAARTAITPQAKRLQFFG
jgi:hypothetical protein